jgi:hypothetical protein
MSGWGILGYQTSRTDFFFNRSKSAKFTLIDKKFTAYWFFIFGGNALQKTLSIVPGAFVVMP